MLFVLNFKKWEVERMPQQKMIWKMDNQKMSCQERIQKRKEEKIKKRYERADAMRDLWDIEAEIAYKFGLCVLMLREKFFWK